MKKRYIIWTVTIFLVVISLFLFLRIGNGGEDNWIKDSRGVYVKHGNPSSVPKEVAEQQSIINCAQSLYFKIRQSGMIFNSQCLGKCMDYSVDIVHVPRTEEDNEIKNQCSDFRSGITHYFIELDKDGKIVRIL